MAGKSRSCIPLTLTLCLERHTTGAFKVARISLQNAPGRTRQLSAIRPAVYRLRLLRIRRKASMKADQFTAGLVHLQNRNLSEVMSIQARKIAS